MQSTSYLETLKRLAAQQSSCAMAVMSPPVTWRSNLYARDVEARTGAVIDTGDAWGSLGSTLAVAGTGLGAYHGYKRTGSVGWALLWALAGGLVPIITIPVALAQGFGQPARGSKKG